MNDLAIFTNGAPTGLAQALDIAMACDDDARARYLAIYGVEWSSLITDDLMGASRSYAPTTTAHTAL
jgi:hypothetical protein